MYVTSRWIFGVVLRKNLHLGRSQRREWRPESAKANVERKASRMCVGRTRARSGRLVCEMERVPQIVSERLKTAAPAVEHLDADVLTAFSERSLPQTERKAVLEHLARCGECREIVALALPASEPTQQIARPAYGGWLTWPVLRWGLIAAGLVAITSFGVMRYQRQSSMTAYNARKSEDVSKVAKTLPLSQPAAEPSEDNAKLQTPAASVPTEQRDRVRSEERRVGKECRSRW